MLIGSSGLVAARRASEGGFTFLGVLFAVAFLGISLAAAGTLWSTVSKREREAELLYVGDEIRAAIGDYYTHGPAPAFPPDWRDLIQDQRFPAVRRHLRKLYADPMTGQADWQIIRDPNGAIMGVASNSHKTPMKRANFSAADAAFEDAECYCDWQFVYLPQAGQRRVKPQP
jgi:type II secretory pathway pseudopilin PulG